MTDRGILRRGRVGFAAALIALAMLISAVPASADPGNGRGGAQPTNITWESTALNITWE